MIDFSGLVVFSRPHQSDHSHRNSVSDLIPTRVTSGSCPDRFIKSAFLSVILGHTHSPELLSAVPPSSSPTSPQISTECSRCARFRALCSNAGLLTFFFGMTGGDCAVVVVLIRDLPRHSPLHLLIRDLPRHSPLHLLICDLPRHSPLHHWWSPCRGRGTLHRCICLSTETCPPPV